MYSVTAALAVRHAARALFGFQDRCPNIAIDLNVSDVRIDLVREAADIAIRLGPLADSSMQRKFVARSSRVLVASRDYVARQGHPKSLDELRHHQAIRMSNVADSGTLVLIGELRHPPPSRPPMPRRTNTGHSLRALLL